MSELSLIHVIIRMSKRTLSSLAWVIHVTGPRKMQWPIILATVWYTTSQIITVIDTNPSLR